MTARFSQAMRAPNTWTSVLQSGVAGYLLVSNYLQRKAILKLEEEHRDFKFLFVRSSYINTAVLQALKTEFGKPIMLVRSDIPFGVSEDDRKALREAEMLVMTMVRKRHKDLVGVPE